MTSCCRRYWISSQGVGGSTCVPSTSGALSGIRRSAVSSSSPSSLNVPIPPLFLFEWELSRYEVMDGQQRLNAVLDFYNGYALKGLEIWKELNGFRYKELPDTLQRGLDRRRLSATVLLTEATSQDSEKKNDIRKLVFERLNTGGLALTPQELRNCLYAGPFNELLIVLARGTLFCKIWDIPPYSENVDREGRPNTQLAENPLYKRMRDCEIVLRYFAFSQPNLRGSVRSILDKCMKDALSLCNSDRRVGSNISWTHRSGARDFWSAHISLSRYRWSLDRIGASLRRGDGCVRSALAKPTKTSRPTRKSC